MPGTYKVTGIDPGPTAFQLGNCLTMRKSRDVVNTPGMYGKTRGLAMGWMNSAGTSHNFIFFEELFASEVAIDYVVSEPGQQGDAMEGAVLVVALLIAFPNARFGLGLPGGDSALGSSDHYRSLGTTPPLDLSEADRDGAPRHLRVRALPRTRDHPRDALQIRRAAGPSCASKARRSSPLESERSGP